MSKITRIIRAYAAEWRTAFTELAEGMAHLADNPLPAALIRQHAAQSARRGCDTTFGRTVLSILALLVVAILAWFAIEVFSAENSTDAMVLGRINALAATSVMVLYGGLVIAFWLFARIPVAVQFSVRFLSVRPGGSAAFDQLDDMVAISHLHGGDMLAAALRHVTRLLLWPLAAVSLYLCLGGGEYLAALFNGDGGLLPEYGLGSVILRLLTAVLVFISGMMAMWLYCALALHAGRMGRQQVMPVIAGWVVVFQQLMLASIPAQLIISEVSVAVETLLDPRGILLIAVLLVLIVLTFLLSQVMPLMRGALLLAPTGIDLCVFLVSIDIPDDAPYLEGFGWLALGAAQAFSPVGPAWSSLANSGGYPQAPAAIVTAVITALVFQLVLLPVALFLAHGSVQARRHFRA